MTSDKKSLHYLLTAVDELVENAREHALGIPVELVRAKKALGLIDLNGIPLEWNMDVSKMQKTLIERFRGNYFLEQAISGESTIEEGLRELHSVSEGIKLFLPQIKNRKHNKKVEELEKLINYENLKIEGLRTHNPWFANNITTAALYGALFGYLLPASESTPPFEIWPAIAFATISAISIGGITTVVRSSIEGSLDRAKYLDKKIEELYKP